MEKILERFISYAKVDTKSDSSTGLTPSTEGQRNLANMLKVELDEMGLVTHLDENSYLFAKVKGNIDGAKTVGFISHLDTAPDANGSNVKPQIHSEYDGKAIDLGNGVIIDPNENPDLLIYRGHTIITSDGTTLLGGDDKGGIAAIVTAIDEILQDKSFEYGDIVIGFTPDEEIGEGGDNFDVAKFGADFAFTVDGETMGEFNYETFNAAEAVITIKGHNVHPGYAMNKMVNALELGCKLANMLPVKDKPEHTEGYEGFFHLCEMKGDVSECELVYIIRDFSKIELERKKKVFEAIVSEINKDLPYDAIKLNITDEYYNMREILEDKKEIIEYAKKAYENCGLNFDIRPIRGGTDGSKLSFKGLPCPNIFVGGNNLHSVKEFLSLDAMKKAKDVIKEIVKVVALDK